MEQRQKKPLFKKWWFWLILVLFMLGIIGAASSATQTAVPDVINKALPDAEATLDEAGFTQIEIESDTGKAVIDKENWVVSSQTPEAGLMAGNSDTITLTVKNAVEKEKGEVNAVVGGSVTDAMSTLSNLGYIANYKHEKTKADFTEDMEFWDDGELSKWVVTGVNDINMEKKTVTVYMNTQENIDAEAASDNMTETLKEKLPVEYAWQAVEQYGEKQYPYGFKLRWITGKLAEKANDENTWFLKANCEITNEYGETVKGNCEAQVTGTQDDPQVINFMCY